MYLSAYHFDGNPTALLEGYTRLQASYPEDSLDLHVCTIGERGIVVLDACPDKETAENFSSSPEFRGALHAAGLPAPRIARLGEVHTALLREAARR